MKVAVESIEGCKRRLAVEAPVDVVQQEWERAYGRVQKQARLPGFRKGHVPRSLVKVHFADDVRREVAEHLIPDVYRQGALRGAARPRERARPPGGPAGGGRAAQLRRRRRGQAGDHARRVPGRRGPARADAGHRRRARRGARADARAAGAVPRRRARRPRPAISSSSTTRWPSTGTSRRARPATSSWWARGNVLPEIDDAVVGMRAGEERQVTLRFADDHRREDLRGKAGHGQRQGRRGQGKGAARARRRLRQVARRVRDPGRPPGRGAEAARGAARARRAAGAGGQGRRRGARAPRVHRARRDGHAPGRPPDRARARVGCAGRASIPSGCRGTTTS